MTESEYNQLREQGWRRKLSPAKEAELRAWLAAHPEAGADWETEVGLTAALGQLPNVPVPSNFTTRVLQTIQREAAAEVRERAPRRNWFLRSLLPKAAAVAVVFGVGLLTYHEHTSAKRAELVQGVQTVSGVVSLPSPEVLQDFDAIRQLNAGRAGADKDLLTLMSYSK